MRAVMVAVQYHDLLSATLPRNRHHFSDVMVVTAPGDPCAEIARANDARVYETRAFWERGAAFNKWLALERGLDAFGRHGLLAIVDADVIWPAALPACEYEPGYLYSPVRRMAPWPLEPIPPEGEWGRYPIHRNLAEHAGYTQIFAADDPHLPPPPWHDVGWRTAGAADSFFQALWPASHKRRPPWECLHLGEAGVNWAGRATAFSDGSRPPEADEKVAYLRALIRKRGTGPDRFTHEKLPPA